MKHQVVNKECLICGDAERVTEHHLIPVTVHKNKWFKKHTTKEQRVVKVDLCFSCHKDIHKMFKNNKELARELGTKDKFMGNEKIKDYIKYKVGRPRKDKDE